MKKFILIVVILSSWSSFATNVSRTSLGAGMLDLQDHLIDTDAIEAAKTLLRETPEINSIIVRKNGPESYGLSLRYDLGNLDLTEFRIRLQSVLGDKLEGWNLSDDIIEISR